MRRHLTILPLLATLFAVPDEGQWLPSQVREMDWEQLRARGMQLTRDEFWDPDKGGVLNAAVQIGGCSASFVSADGLLVTNHHCGFGAVNALSTIEKNYLRDGFVAGSRPDELPTNLVVSVVRRIEDVTARVHAAQARAGGDLERARLTEQEIEAICKAAELDPVSGEKDPMTTCSVAAFLEGREYHLYYRTRLTDVRLVYAPPRAVGEYGGEVDNWEWPRHTGDFMFFRAYVAPDGTPRRHHADNVPFHPQHWLRVAPDGVHEGDLVLVLGYPGRTERYLTSTAVQQRQTFTYPARLDLFTRMIEILERAGADDPALALRLQSTIKSMANTQKNALGMVKGLARNGVVAAKRAAESEFRQWVDADPERQSRFGGVLDDVIALDEEAATTQHEDLLMSLAGGRFGRQVLPILDVLSRMLAAAQAQGDAESPQYSGDLLAAVASPRATDALEQVQKPMLTLLLEEIAGLPPAQSIELPEALQGTAPMAARVQALFERSQMLDPERRIALLQAGRSAIERSADPLLALARCLGAEYQAYEQRRQTRDGAHLRIGRRWIDAQQEWRGESFYPDANSTLRVSIAEVRGYQPRDGVRYTPHTTVAGLLDKATGEEPFVPPAVLRAAASDRRDSRFFDAAIGDVPVCFLANADTTGGNSGSPVINGKGELVGLNFDRVFENVAGDYGWNAERSRNISVDIRFVLWHVESVMPAPQLLAELLP